MLARLCVRLFADFESTVARHSSRYKVILALQGDSFAEFLKIAKRYAPGSAASRRSLAQRVRAGVDSVARLAIYRFFG